MPFLKRDRACWEGGTRGSKNLIVEQGAGRYMTGARGYEVGTFRRKLQISSCLRTSYNNARARARAIPRISKAAKSIPRARRCTRDARRMSAFRRGRLRRGAGEICVLAWHYSKIRNARLSYERYMKRAPRRTREICFMEQYRLCAEPSPSNDYSSKCCVSLSRCVRLCVYVVRSRCVPTE